MKQMIMKVAAVVAVTLGLIGGGAAGTRQAPTDTRADVYLHNPPGSNNRIP